MALDVALRCSRPGCGKLFAASAEHGVPALMAYCPDCAQTIGHTIKKSMMQDAGLLHGSVRTDAGHERAVRRD